MTRKILQLLTFFLSLSAKSQKASCHEFATPSIITQMVMFTAIFTVMFTAMFVGQSRHTPQGSDAPLTP
jgi:hypothetical protein